MTSPSIIRPVGFSGSVEQLIVNSTVAGEVTAYLWGGGGGGGGGPDGNTLGGGYGPTKQGSTATDPFHGVFSPGTSGYYISVLLVYNDVGNLIDTNRIGYCVVVNDVVVYLNQTGPGQPDALPPPFDLAFRRNYVGYSYYNGTPGPYQVVEAVECYNFSYSAVSPGAAGNGQAGSYSRITFNVEPGDLIDVGVGQGGGAGKIRTAPTNGNSGGPYYQGSTATNPFPNLFSPDIGVPGGTIAPGTSGYYIFGVETAQGANEGSVPSFQPYSWCVVVDGVIVYGPSTYNGASAPPESFAKQTSYVGFSYYRPEGNLSLNSDAVQCWNFQYTASGPGGNISAGGQPGLGYSPKEIFSSRTPGPGDPVFAVKNVAYNEFMNAYGVWEQDNVLPNFTRTYDVYFPISSKYIFAMGCDTYGRVYLDDVLFMEGQGYANTGSPVEYVLYVEQGFHTVKMQGQGGALLPLWTTRSAGYTGNVLYPGVEYLPSAQALLNTYGVWINPSSDQGGRSLSDTWSVNFPSTGYYTIQGQSIGCGINPFLNPNGNPGTLSIDGVATLVCKQGGFLQQSTVLITAGTHTISVYADSSRSRGNTIQSVAFTIQLDPGVAGANSMALAIALPGSLNAYCGGVGGSSGAQGISGSGGGGGGATTLFKNGQLIAVAAGGGGGGGAGRLDRILQCDAPGIGGLNTAYDGVPTGTAGQYYLGDGGGGGGAGGGVQGGLGGGTRGNETTAFGGANGTSLGDYTETAASLDTPGQESPYWDRFRGTGGLGGSVFTAIPQSGGPGYAVLVFKQSGIRVKDEDEWKSPRVIWIKQNNVWTQVDTVWVKDSTGQWNKVLGSNSSAPDFEPLYNQMGWTYYPYPLGDQPAPPPPPPDPPPGYVVDGSHPSWGVF